MIKIIIFTALIMLALTARADGCYVTNVIENGQVHAYEVCCYGGTCSVQRIYWEVIMSDGITEWFGRLQEENKILKSNLVFSFFIPQFYITEFFFLLKAIIIINIPKLKISKDLGSGTIVIWSSSYK